MMQDESHIELPSYRNLMYPTLEALEQLGGEASTNEIDERVIEIAGLTKEQLAVSFANDAQQTGSKVIHRLAWSRSYLGKLDLVERPRRGTWALTTDGRHYLALDDGEAEILHREHELRVGKHPEAFLKQAAQRADSGDPWSIAVRELLGEWDVSRRGSAVVVRIARDLKEEGLETDPPFANVPLDSEVTIRPLALHDENADGVQADVPESSTVTIGTLPKARGVVASVRPDDPLIKAQSLMESGDYSQLAVTTGDRGLKGAISWETIAKANLYGSAPERVRDAMDHEPVAVYDDQPLLDQVATIANAGYVFVRDRTNLISGIVTSADISEEFANLANPFLLLGEIEGWLRQLVDTVFASSEDLAAYVDPDDPDRQIEAASNLTFGEYVRLFQDPDAWSLLGLTADRAVFCQHLDEVRQIRNSIMHFSPDPLQDSDLFKIRSLSRWVRTLAQLRIA